MSDYRYLIIGGTTKAATTSLFFYLADHPQVCASSMKEPRFFLDADYPLVSKYRFEDGLEKYDEFFSHCPDPSLLRTEATPDYLYSWGTSYKIRHSLPEVKLVFILREPISRLISWYRFSQQGGLLSVNTSIDDYIQSQLSFDDVVKPKQYMRSLEQGRYSIYLQPYFEVFNSDEIFITFYEDLSKDPKKIISDLCEFAGIDPAFYAQYDFKIFNKTRNLRNPGFFHLYNRLRFNIRQRTHNKREFHELLKKIRLIFETVYFRIDKQKPSEDLVISPELWLALRKYYQREVQVLEQLLGRRVPW